MIHQALVTYKDGAEMPFLSEDGHYFYEKQLPDPNGRTRPLRYSREWLKQTAREWDGIKSIEFTEVGAHIGGGGG